MQKGSKCRLCRSKTFLKKIHKTYNGIPYTWFIRVLELYDTHSTLTKFLQTEIKS